MNFKGNIDHLIKNYGTTYVTEFLIAGISFLIYPLAARKLGATGFYEYLVALRALSFINPLLLLGTGVGIPRFIALANGENKKSASSGYFVAGLAILCVSMVTMLLPLNIFNGLFSRLIFGSTEYNELVFPLSMMAIGFILHSACYSYYRGCLNMNRANLIQLTNSGILPLLVIIIFGQDVYKTILMNGVACIVFSGIFVFEIFLRMDRCFGRIKPFLKELLVYSLPRVPGDLALASLYILPVVLSSNTGGIKEGGIVAFGVAILSKIGFLFSPISIVLLPQASFAMSRMDFQKLARELKKILILSLGLVFGLALIFEVNAEKIIIMYLGDQYINVANPIRIVMIGSLPIVAYTILRSLLDAFYKVPLNGINILISLLILIIGMFVSSMRSSNEVLVVMVIAIYVLGLLTTIGATRILIKGV
jgi:O-antigen/teichoic acid export membrane protein